jgi:hypothetical protein
MCIVTLWYMLLLVCARKATLIYNQDGFGFSGTIQANPIVYEIAMTAYNSWPAEVYSTTKKTPSPAACLTGSRCGWCRKAQTQWCVCVPTGGRVRACWR